MNAQPVPARKPLTIKGADGKPVEIAHGEWYQNPKARARRMMLNSLSSKARRVYACLELATMGFRQEMAVKLVEGKKRPLRPSDIAEQTELDPTDVAHALAELKDAGLAERRADGGLRNGRIRIYSFAVPPTEEGSTKPGARTRFCIPAWVNSRPDDDPLKQFINRCKISFSSDFVVARSNIEAAEVAARDYKHAESLLRAALESCGAQPSLIRRKETERNSERKGAPAASSAYSGAVAEAAPAALPPSIPRRDEVAQIVACASQFSDLDWTGAERLLDDCRAIAPDAPVAAINCWIQKKAPKALKSKNPSGFLIRAVPECFQGEWRAVLTLPAPQKTEDDKAREEREQIDRIAARLAAQRNGAGA